MIAEPVVPSNAATEIPDKLYFRIGDVSRLAGVKPFVLRFWESEFPQLAPKKSGTGHRLYRRKDVEAVLEIKRLLYDERFTIEGARNYLQNRVVVPAAKPATKAARKQKAAAAAAGAGPIAAPAASIVPLQGDLFGSGVPVETLQTIRRELESILSLLR